MIISKDIWNVSTGVELVRNGNDVTLILAGSASGYYDEYLGYWEWYGWMEAQFGEAYDWVEQYYDRPMDMSLTETLTAGVATTGNYYVDGSPSEYTEFSAIIFDSVANYTGTAGIDFVFGSGANDKLSGAAGNDGLDGGAGDDWLNGGVGGDHLEGGDGLDTASYAGATAGVVARLYNSALGSGDAGGDRYISIERLEGSSHGDHLYGDDKVNTLWGRDGADTLFGRGGNDLLLGGKGADLLFGDAGIDTASYADSSSGVVANLTTGLGTAGDALGDEYNGIEGLIGSAFTDELTGNGAGNILRGLNSNDTLRGLAGDDRLIGGNGDDLLIGGIGADWLDGGLGTDTASYASATAGVVANLDNASLNTREALGDTYVSIENLRGSSFNDRLTGNAQENAINGGDGNDTLNGGGASDRLSGGNGKDAFTFDSGLDGLNNVDVILDYSVADDRILLEADVFSAFTATGRIANAAFTAGTEATTAAHRIIYNAANGTILYDADGAGGADAIAFARVTAGLAMSGAEFIVI